MIDILQGFCILVLAVVAVINGRRVSDLRGRMGGNAYKIERSVTDLSRGIADNTNTLKILSNRLDRYTDEGSLQTRVLDLERRNN